MKNVRNDLLVIGRKQTLETNDNDSNAFASAVSEKLIMQMEERIEELKARIRDLENQLR